MSTMPKYIVSATLQSADRSNAPVDQRWYTGDSLAQAISAMVGAAARHEDVDAHVPASVRYSTLGVHLSIEQEVITSCEVCGARHVVGEDCPNYGSGEQHSATPSTVRAFDTETVAYSLSDCAYWNTPGEECAGPRVGVVIATDDILCEKHFNHPPQ